MIQSAIYRTKVKRMVALLKSVGPRLTRLPAPLPRPGSEAFKAPKVWEAKQSQERQERYEKLDSKRLDRSAAPFWLQTLTFDETRRSRS